MTHKSILDLPCFIINLDRHPERLKYTTDNVRNAGFIKIERFSAIDGKLDPNNTDIIYKKLLNNIPYVDNTNKLSMANTISHLSVWKKILESDIEEAILFEDDIFFHENWSSLHQKYYNETPTDYDIIYLGSGRCGEYENFYSGYIINEPLYCLHAYLISKNFIRHFFTEYIKSISCIYLLDCELFNMKRDIPSYKFYGWVNNDYNDKILSHLNKNIGLVYQDYKFGTSLTCLQTYINQQTYIEGHCGNFPEYLSKLDEVLAEYKDSKHIFEIGFNIGTSSDFFLDSFKSSKVTSVDIGCHGYVKGAKKCIDILYPFRHKLYIGDSTDIVPKLKFEHTFDIIFIDGGHMDDIPYKDIINCKRLANKNTIVIIDDIVLSAVYVRDFNISPINAWNRAISEGILSEEGSVEFSPGRGFAWGKYLF